MKYEIAKKLLVARGAHKWSRTLLSSFRQGADSCA